jgi:hypothetical protein
VRDQDFGLPDMQSAAVDENGVFTAEWQRGITRLGQLSAERKIRSVSPGLSPYTFTASTIGHLLISGGTVSAVTLTRGTTTVSCPSGFIPMAANDSVVVTYTVAPTLNFIAGARA